MKDRFPKDCWKKKCPHFECWDMSVDDLCCSCDLLKIQCDACDEDFSLYLCPLPNKPTEKGKVFRVEPKENPKGVFYMVDAPSKRIAKWCGANLFNNEYTAFSTAKDMIAKRFKLKGGEAE